MQKLTSKASSKFAADDFLQITTWPVFYDALPFC